MPTIDRFGPYRVFFYMADRREPPHVHVERDDCMVKLWLDGLGVAVNRGFPAREVRLIVQEVEKRRHAYRDAWIRAFG